MQLNRSPHRPQDWNEPATTRFGAFGASRRVNRGCLRLFSCVFLNSCYIGRHANVVRSRALGELPIFSGVVVNFLVPSGAAHSWWKARGGGRITSGCTSRGWRIPSAMFQRALLRSARPTPFLRRQSPSMSSSAFVTSSASQEPPVVGCRPAMSQASQLLLATPGGVLMPTWTGGLRDLVVGGRNMLDCIRPSCQRRDQFRQFLQERCGRLATCGCSVPVLASRWAPTRATPPPRRLAIEVPFLHQSGCLPPRVRRSVRSA